MKVFYDKPKKYFEIKSKDVKSMLKELKILRNTVVVTANNELVDESYSFSKNDKVKILSVVSGG
jgi:sulfur carrier protein ThiS